MKLFDFPDERTCPLCSAGFRQAEKRPEYDPVIVVVCPQCNKLLWLPGLDSSTASLHPFDPNAEEDGI